MGHAVDNATDSKGAARTGSPRGARLAAAAWY